jgi:hypothetical protein
MVGHPCNVRPLRNSERGDASSILAENIGLCGKSFLAKMELFNAGGTRQLVGNQYAAKDRISQRVGLTCSEDMLGRSTH